MAQPTGYWPAGIWPDGYWADGYWPDGHAYQDLTFDLSVASALTSDRILVESAVGSTSVTTKKALTSDRLRLTT